MAHPQQSNAARPPTDERFFTPLQRATLDAAEAEFLRVRGHCTGTIDVAGIRTKQKDIEQHLSPPAAAIRPDAPDDLPVFRFLFARDFAQLETAARVVGTGLHPRARYSNEAKRLHGVHLQLLRRLRKRAGERLPKDARLARAGMTVGKNVNERSPLAVYDGLVSQLATCRDPQYAQLFADAGVSRQRWTEELTRAVAELGGAVHGGTVDESTLAGNSRALQDAVLRLEILFSRAAVWLEDWVSEKAAAALEADVPHRAGRRNKTAREEEPEEGMDTEANDDAAGEESAKRVEESGPTAKSEENPTPAPAPKAPSEPDLRDHRLRRAPRGLIRERSLIRGGLRRGARDASRCGNPGDAPRVTRKQEHAEASAAEQAFQPPNVLLPPRHRA